jgi:hypothetical protein
VECQQLVNTLVRAFDDLQQTTAALDRLEMVSRFIHQPPKDLDLAQQSWAHHQANPQGAATRAAALGRPVVTCLAQLYSVAYSLAPRSLCDRLEGSFVDQAELVFTTLSSSARDVFAKLQRPFELVGGRVVGRRLAVEQQQTAHGTAAVVGFVRWSVGSQAVAETIPGPRLTCCGLLFGCFLCILLAPHLPNTTANMHLHKDQQHPKDAFLQGCSITTLSFVTPGGLSCNSIATL